ncbi:MAG: bacterioferritin [Gammaproteobacteria bacterium]|nr:bacterioferritin [Gammaproteobacteria bacterium]
MKGNKKIIDCLNSLLSGELAARDQYFIHSLMYDEWGYQKLFEHSAHESDHEKLHAEQMVRRILMLGGIPVSAPCSVNIGNDVVGMLKSDLDLEYSVCDNLRTAIKLCEECQDYVTRDMLVTQLEDSEEDHAHWLEKQLSIIDAIGLQNYLQSKTA